MIELLERLAINYIKWKLKIQKIKSIEVVINKDFDTIRTRDFKREESIKKTLSKIK